MAIDNLERLEPLLVFGPGEFYYVQILKRKKDQATDKSNHQSVRTIKEYYVTSYDDLVSKMKEIITLCETFKARAYINPNPINTFDVSHAMGVELFKRLRNGVFDQSNLFSSVVGKINEEKKSNRWVVDVDIKDEGWLGVLEDGINTCRPVGNKIIAKIPTLAGFHFITNRFDRLQFSKTFDLMYEKSEPPAINENSPTLLYLSDSIINQNEST